MQIHLDSIGCRLNQSEMEDLARQLAGRGHQIVDSPEQADLVVLNTCAVTQEAERKSRQAARRFHRANPHARLFLTGCYATLSPSPPGSIPGVTQVVGNQEKHQLLSLIDPEPGPPARSPVWRLPTSRTRAFVKIQDGCDNRCTFCITTIARGPSRSRPQGEIIAEIQSLVAAGYQEVVLTGVHVGNYLQEEGRKAPKAPLKQLVRTILDETSLPRLRLSSLEPWDLDESFFALWDNPRLCRQLHLPLQSGSASVLRRMARRTSPDAFQRLACAALEAIPGLALTTDLIVGFPGESQAEFEESLDFVDSLDFSRLHVFAFSPRPGTAAAGMADQLPKSIIKERGLRMRKLGVEKSGTFMRRFLGRTLEVLWESSISYPGQPTLWRGYTDNYIRVNAFSDHSLHNTITPTRLTELQAGAVRGIVLDPNQARTLARNNC